MTRRFRLIFLGLSFVLLVIVGWWATGGLSFLLTQFWFTSGLFLLILLSLVDQPFFSRDANIFVNGTTGWVSLLLVSTENRDGTWWLFFSWSTYLIISSYLLMWIRQRELLEEGRAVQVISRLNRQIGRPEALFSAFFLWGCTRQFGLRSGEFDSLLLFWVVFMILNLPSVATALAALFTKTEVENPQRAGLLLSIVSPRIAEVIFNPHMARDLVGKNAIMSTDGKILGEGVVIDDRIVSGQRRGRIAITKENDIWTSISDESKGIVSIEVKGDLNPTPADNPISVIDTGSDIGSMVIKVHPDIDLQEGEVLWVQFDPENKAFYQIVDARIGDTALSDGNVAQSIKVVSGQLGFWQSKKCRFDSITWVPPAGQLVYRATSVSKGEHQIPKGQLVVGKVPNSDFPIHVSLQDIVTHNAAIIGVTGSGKSYLAFHLIEAMVAEKIRVLVLDMSRQHWLFLGHLKPTQLTMPSDVTSWLQTESFLGIHQFAGNDASFPLTTSNFIEAAFKELSKTKLKAGMNEPARLCIVLEEAHSLIPEWNQVAQQSDVQCVNRTARNILQGRKYGMGCLVITQRTANVTKTILNQCNTVFALQSFDQTGLDFLKNYMGETYAHTISTLPTYSAILVGKASSSARPILFRIQDFEKRWQEVDAQKADEVASVPSPPAQDLKQENTQP